MEKENMILIETINETYDDVKTEAILERALTEKITNETINQKVLAQVNSINVSMNKINPKFNEKSKNYDIVKENILDSMTKYENALKDLSKFYDGKIEQLIIRKLELQLEMVGLLVSNKYYLDRYNAKKTSQENFDKKPISSVIKRTLEKIKQRKQKNELDTYDINKLSDKEQIESEQKEKLDTSVGLLKIEIENLKEKIKKDNKEIYLVTTEVKRLNQRKKQAILDAMETGDKWLVTNIKKPKTFQKITRFFSSKINTPKVINKTIIEPFNSRINYFIENDLKFEENENSKINQNLEEFTIKVNEIKNNINLKYKKQINEAIKN